MSTQEDPASDHAGRSEGVEQAPDWEAFCNGGDFCTKVRVQGALIHREVKLFDKNREHCWSVKEVIRPAWIPVPDSDTAVSEFEKHYADASAQARSTAKWMATILGVALAALIGSAPLSGMRGQNIPLGAYIAGGVGLACIVVTLFLVLRVLVPQITGFEDLIDGQGAFADLKERFQRNSGVLLPRGVGTFAELGGRARIEVGTLDHLATKAEECSTDPTRKGEFKVLRAAREGRAKYLEYLSTTIAQWTVVASYQDVKRRAGWARILGLITGAIGTALIVVAFLLPTPQSPPVNLATYKIAKNDPAASPAQDEIGAKCTKFKGVIVKHDSSGNLNLLVQGSDTCPSKSMTMCPGPGCSVM